MLEMAEMRSYQSSAADTGTFSVVAVRGGADFAITWGKFSLTNGRLTCWHGGNSGVNQYLQLACLGTRTWRAHLKRIIHCQANMIVSDEVHTASFVATPSMKTVSHDCGTECVMW